MKHCHRKFIFTTLLMIATLCLYGQNGQNNPFEMQHRQEASGQKDSGANDNPFELDRETQETAGETAPSANQTQNPFELEKSEEENTPTEHSVKTNENPFELQKPTNQATPPSSESATNNDNPFELNRKEKLLRESGGLQKTTNTKPAAIEDELSAKKIKTNFFFWVILVVLILLAMLSTLYRNIILKVYRSFTNDNFLKLVHREQAGFIGFPYLLLYIFFFINAGVFLLLIANHFDLRSAGNPYLSLLKYTLWIAAFFIAKQLLLNLLSNIFAISKEMRQYSFMITIFGIMIGLFLIPFNIIAAFAPAPIPGVVLVGALFLISLVYLFRFVRGLFLASRYISMHKFHFFMYLCTVEMAPVIVLLKIVLLKTGAH